VTANPKVDDADPLQRRSTPISRADAEARYTTCCVCGGLLPTSHLYLCEDCGKPIEREEQRT
jgi:predicted amidophosphoribosyltransferase